jgi:hypothetical protein
LFNFVVGQFVPENGGGLSPVDEGLSDVGHFYVGSGGEGLGVLFVERGLQG